MPLESIRKSKAAVMRDKDPAHIHYIGQNTQLRRESQMSFSINEVTICKKAIPQKLAARHGFEP